MLQLVVLAIIIFLIWAEIIPARAWIFEVKALLIGAFTRTLISILGLLDELLDSE